MPRAVLIIDDEVDAAASLRDLLRTLPDTEVETASSFAEGRAKAGARAWDLVIADERLPDGRGLDILEEVSRRSPDTLRVLTSAFSDFDMMLRAVNVAHIDHFIEKPPEPEEVLAWVEQALEARSALARRAARRGPFQRVGGAPRA